MSSNWRLSLWDSSDLLGIPRAQQTGRFLGLKNSSFIPASGDSWIERYGKTLKISSQQAASK